MQRGLTWRIIKELDKLYWTGTIKPKPYLVGHAYVKHLESFNLISIERKVITVVDSAYKQYYEDELLESYSKCKDFLEKHKLLEPYWNFKEEDILTLMIIEANRPSIIESGQTKNQISSFYFRHEDAKYLRKSVSLSKAILQILDVSRYPEDEKDNQYIICVPTKKAKLVLLCENIDKLRLPQKYRESDVELWYSGGKNISKLAGIRENEKLPFYYVCDWDHDGLLIYHAIKRQYIPHLELVIPKDWKSVKKPLGNHKSLWRDMSTYDLAVFTEEQKKIVVDLIETGSWIEEESFPFALDEVMFNSNGQSNLALSRINV